MDMLSVFYMLYWNISEKTRGPSPGDIPFFSFFFLIPTVFSSWYPLGLTPPPVKVAVIESRHGTTHCLNTVDHSRWNHETPSWKEWAAPQKAPHTLTGLNLQHLTIYFSCDEPHLALCRQVFMASTIHLVWCFVFFPPFASLPYFCFIVLKSARQCVCAWANR